MSDQYCKISGEGKGNWYNSCDLSSDMQTELQVCKSIYLCQEISAVIYMNIQLVRMCTILYIRALLGDGF